MDIDKEEVLMKQHELVRVLGEGSFGKVYLIRNLINKREYALKKYSKSFLENRGKQRSLIRSIFILKNLHHKNIIKFITYVINSDDDSIYLLYESCKKGSLQSLKGHLISYKCHDIIKSVLWQLAQGLLYLKATSVAHRDLKPGNITFTHRGELKIIDFDQAVCFNQESMKMSETQMLRSFVDAQTYAKFVSRRSRASNYVGTEAYMSPQMKQNSITDEQGDIWAYGCIMYELMMGELMFFQFQDEAKFTQNVSSKLSLLKQALIEPETIDLIQKTMAYDPNSRIKIEQIVEHPYFAEMKKPQICQKYQKRLTKMLRHNFGLMKQSTKIDAMQMQLIGMKSGKEVFQNLNTGILLKNKNIFRVCLIIGGGQYFKIKSPDDSFKQYLDYNLIENICVQKDQIKITITKEPWNVEAEDQIVIIKHIYPHMLTNLFDMLRYVLQN